MPEGEVERFNRLVIEPSQVQKMEFVPLKSLSLTLMLVPGGLEYDLQFSKILDVTLTAAYRNKWSVIGHHARMCTDRLDALKAIAERLSCRFDLNRLCSYKIVCQEGVIEVLAEEFSLVNTWDVRASLPQIC